MDTPRRWQLASLATAVVSLGFGGAMLARPSIDEVPSIDLDQVEASAGPSIQRGLVEDDPGDLVSPRIVLPASPTSPETVASPGSISSPDEAADPAPRARPASPLSVPTPASADSPPSAVSVSADSEDSIESSD